MELYPLPDFEALLHECIFIASCSSGKGGQNVNKVATKVSLRFDILNSELLTADQKEWLTGRLGGRVSKLGVLQITSQKERTQLANKKASISRFKVLILKAFDMPVKRKASKPTRASKERRLKDKAHLAIKKSARSGSMDNE
jgi:ribosome-associated protein